MSSAISVGFAAPAWAQEQLDTEQTSDIIVTARRTEERLQDVPISITVFNQQQLNNRNVVSADDLAAYTPSLTSNSRFGAGNATFAIRGFTQELRTSPSVAVYFADVVAPRAGNGGTPSGNGAGPGSFFDLQNVQVLKGPQGTLFGRNTTGGAVLLVPHKPTSNLEGYIEASYGSHDMKRLQGVLNVPLGDQARLRVSVDRYKRDGYVRSYTGIGPSDFNDNNYIAARASLVVDLTPDLENYTIVSYTRSDTNGPLGKVTRSVGAGLFANLSAAQIARQSPFGFYASENGLANPRSLIEQWQIINTTTYRASDALTVKNIASYGQIKSLLRAEIFGTRFIIPQGFGATSGQSLTFANSATPPGFDSAAQSSFTEELQFQGNTGERLIWQAGAYFEISDPLRDSGSQSAVLASCTNLALLQCSDPIGTLSGIPGAVGSVNYALGRTSFRNLGLYAQSTYTLTDRLKLTGGIRYTSDRTKTVANSVTYRFFTPNVATGFCTLAPVTNPAIRNPNECRQGATQKSNAPTWLIDLDYKPADDLLLYAKYSRGYRQGSANYSAPAAFQTFGPERVDAYEVGAKSSFRGAIAGTFNIAGFYNDFSNQQLAVGLLSTTGTPTQAIINGGKSRIYGVEVDASITPFSGFTLDGGYAYLNTKLLSLSVPPLPTGSVFNGFQFAAIAGSRLSLTPKHKLSATATYRLPLPDSIGALSVAATYTYTSNQIVVATPLGTLPSISLLNLNLNWNKIGGSTIDGSLFATNVTKQKYYNYINDQTRQGFISQTVGEPRMYGVRLRYSFGR